MRDRILVPFEGPGEGVEPLSWAQRGLWQTTQNDGKSVTMGGVTELPPGTTVQALADALQFAISRHQALRTRLCFDADGTVRQAVSSSGVTEMAVVDAGEDDPAAVAAAVLEEFQSYDFDYAQEWPVRTAAIPSKGVVTHYVVVYLHLVIDAFGLQVLLADLASRDPADRPEQRAGHRDDADRAGPLAADAGRAAAQRSVAAPSGEGAADRVAGPVRPAAGRPPAGVPAAELPVTGHQVGAAGDLAAQEHGHLAGPARAVRHRRHQGDRHEPLRHHAGGEQSVPAGLCATSVSAVAQISACLIDLADVTVDEAIGRARRAAVSAYKYGFYDPPQRVALIERVAADRGRKVDLSCFFSDRRTDRDQELLRTIPTAEQVSQAVGRRQLPLGAGSRRGCRRSSTSAWTTTPTR